VINKYDVIHNIYGAWRFFRFDLSATQYFQSTLENFWKSFFAALIILPAIIVLRIIFLITAPDDYLINNTKYIALVFIIDYTYQWIIFPLVMFYFTDVIHRKDSYITYIVVRNWSQVIQTTIFFPAAMIYLLNSSNNFNLGVYFLIGAYLINWAYEWFIARSTLNVSSVLAAVIVIMSTIISLSIAAVSQSFIISN
jgi:hypothetical protein